MTTRGRDRADHARRRVSLALAFMVLVPALAALLGILGTAERNADSVADDIVERMGERTTGLIGDQLHDAGEITVLLDQLLDERDLATRDAGTTTVLLAQISTHDQISGAFVGYPDGAFRFARRNADDITIRAIDTVPSRSITETIVTEDHTFGEEIAVVDDFDPRTRPWFHQAVRADGVVWTDPYVFFSSGRPGVTAARAIRDASGELLAVVGVDLALDSLTSFLDDLPIDQSAEAFILAGDQVVVAPSDYEVGRRGDDGVLRLATIDDVGLTEVIDVANATEARLGKIDGERFYTRMISDASLPLWTIVVRTERIEFVETSRRQTRIAVGATVVLASLLLAGIPLVVRGIRRPIDELNERARVDHLSQLLNRQTLLEDGRRTAARALRDGQDVVVAVLDLDGFKSINDEHGHDAGDRVISRVAQILRDHMRPGDLVGRLGGDEFAAVMTGVERHDVDPILERLRQAVTHDATTDTDGGDLLPGATVNLGVTIGVSSRAGRTVEIDQLITEADHRLVAAKQAEKGTVAWHDPSEPAAPTE